MSKSRMCRYECGTELGDFDEKQYKYVELSGTLHTRERCESFRTQKVQTKNTKQGTVVGVNERLGPLTMEELDARIKRLEGLVIGAQK
jgi:hypothetical protein